MRNKLHELIVKVLKEMVVRQQIVETNNTVQLKSKNIDSVTRVIYDISIGQDTVWYVRIYKHNKLIDVRLYNSYINGTFGSDITDNEKLADAVEDYIEKYETISKKK
jgi:hypothetical protein